jgi:hypothetical protein
MDFLSICCGVYLSEERTRVTTKRTTILCNQKQIELKLSQVHFTDHVGRVVKFKRCEQWDRGDYEDTNSVNARAHIESPNWMVTVTVTINLFQF